MYCSRALRGMKITTITRAHTEDILTKVPAEGGEMGAMKKADAEVIQIEGLQMERGMTTMKRADAEAISTDRWPAEGGNWLSRILHICYRDITRMLQTCYRDITTSTLILQICYRDIVGILQTCY